MSLTFVEGEDIFLFLRNSWVVKKKIQVGKTTL